MERAPFSTDYWYSIVTNQKTDMSRSELEREMLRTLKAETPQMVSVTMERMCNLQCAHCIYPCDVSSESASREAKLSELVKSAVEQLPSNSPRLLHEGRILRPWHIDVLRTARVVRSDLKIGLIDNGSFTKHIDRFDGLRLDWLDVSVDGDEQAHNAQRRSTKAYRDAIRGLELGREVTKSLEEGGRVTALFTTTSINHASLASAAKALFEPAGKDALVDELHVTTVTPSKVDLLSLEQNDLTEFWKQTQEIYRRYGQANGKQRVFFRLFRHHELAKLARVTSADEVRAAFSEGIRLAPGEVHFNLHGVPFIYAPLSIWPGETFLIDADGAYRTAYSIGYTLADLQKGHNIQGEDLTGYTIAKLKLGFNLARLYRRCVDVWWNFKGRQFLREEADIFKQLSK